MYFGCMAIQTRPIFSLCPSNRIPEFTNDNLLGMVASGNRFIRVIRVMILPKYTARPPITGSELREKPCSFTMILYEKMGRRVSGGSGGVL